MADWLIHAITSATGFIASVIALYVTYRIALLKDWFRTEMARLIKENCASKVEFAAHVESDETFQQNINEMIAKNEINASRLLEAKFETVKTQISSVGERVGHLTQLIERRTR